MLLLFALEAGSVSSSGLALSEMAYRCLHAPILYQPTRCCFRPVSLHYVLPQNAGLH